jgi:hypothetical protein
MPKSILTRAIQFLFSIIMRILPTKKAEELRSLVEGIKALDRKAAEAYDFKSITEPNIAVDDRIFSA